MEISDETEALWIATGVYPNDLLSMAEIAADDAYGALKQGWDRYDIGRSAPIPHTAEDCRQAVECVVAAGPAALKGDDRVDAIRDAALEALGYSVGVRDFQAIVIGRVS